MPSWLLLDLLLDLLLGLRLGPLLWLLLFLLLLLLLLLLLEGAFCSPPPNDPPRDSAIAGFAPAAASTSPAAPKESSSRHVEVVITVR